MTSVPGSILRQMTPGTPYHGKNWAAPDTRTSHLVYVCEFNAGVCNWYRSGHNVVAGQIAASYPNGICDDKNNDVYIPDGGTNHIFVYAKGSTTLIRDLDNTSQGQPSACAVAADGTVYAANVAADTISVYATGATTPTRVITDAAAQSSGGFVLGIAVDERRLLAVSWSNFAGIGGVDEFPNARGTGVTKISSADALASVIFDNAENLVVNDQSSGTSNVYNGNSFAQCNSISAGGDPVFAWLDTTNGDILESDQVNGVVLEETFGDCSGGGALEAKYTAGLSASGGVEGVMFDPGSQQ